MKDKLENYTVRVETTSWLEYLSFKWLPAILWLQSTFFWWLNFTTWLYKFTRILSRVSIIGELLPIFDLKNMGRSLIGDNNIHCLLDSRFNYTSQGIHRILVINGRVLSHWHLQWGSVTKKSKFSTRKQTN
jgi:hypothetical protein